MIQGFTHRMVGTALAVLLASSAFAAAADWSPSPPLYGIGSTKNIAIPMPDGIVLRADLYFPTDLETGQPATGPFPVIVSETPYGKNTAQFAAFNADLGALSGYTPYLVERGYIQALVDVRGTGGSEGSWDLIQPAEGTDSITVIDWAAHLPNSTGKVGMIGVSYVSITQLFAAANVGPNSPLKAIFPVLATNDPYRDVVMTGGLFALEFGPAYLGLVTGINFLNPIAQQQSNPFDISKVLAGHTQSVVDFDARLVLNMGTGGDRGFYETYWRERSPAERLDDIVANGVAVYLVGGLLDVFQGGAPLNFAGLQNAWAGKPVHGPMSSDQPVTGRYQLLIGPWYHTTFETEVLSPIALAWFERWLKDVPTGIDETETPLHVLMPDGHVIDTERYPYEEATSTTYFLNAGGKLAATAPSAAKASDAVLWSPLSQPCNRSTEQWALGTGELLFELLGSHEPCAAQALVPSLPLLALDYPTPAFQAATVLAGPIAVTLHATATTRDTEWIATVFDVAPNGSAVELTSGSLLGSFRALDDERTWKASDGRPILPYHPFTRASKKPVTPGVLTRYDIDVRPTFAVIAAGHKLRVTITTADTPHLAPLPPDLPNLVGGIYQIERSVRGPSSVTLPLAPAVDFGL